MIKTDEDALIARLHGVGEAIADKRDYIHYEPAAIRIDGESVYLQFFHTTGNDQYEVRLLLNSSRDLDDEQLITLYGNELDKKRK